jgi:hypothetical protein
VPSIVDSLPGYERSAVVSRDGLYRYSLQRHWQNAALPGTVVWIMLNPSTADGKADDPTIRRCVGFTERMGYGHLAVVNLFAYRTTHPTVMKSARGRGVDVVGPDNDDTIMRWCREAATIVAAWGASQAVDAGRALQVRRMLDDDPACGPLHCLARTATGGPKHPLYLPNSAELEVL